ncbi:MAG: type I DNA topoisomerase [Candidatus Omnitrophica bacterium]|nr:type I DNA topoisomerase [Candidatus Omnitrophota bacterium]
MKKSKGKALVLVESPTKAKTISRFLDDSYKILSSMGHIVDLPKNKLGIDIEKSFEPSYKVIKGREKLVKEIKKEAKNASKVYLATDPDREGEAISWHIKNLLNDSKDKEFLRVTFHEITSEAIKKAFAHPAGLNLNKINAQQSRRILDRLVGYFLSPFLWKKICRGLSAGRVQSVALKFIVDREKEIQSFIPRKYYIIEVYFKKGDATFKARLVKEKGKKIELPDKEKAEEIKRLILNKEFLIKKINARSSLRKPYPPFITSSLQQEAFRNFRFSTTRTMIAAQKLYEGIELKEEGMVGLITYMRTDSFHISPQAKKEAKKFILEDFGQNYLSGKEYKFKSKGIIQAAHEAIRPTEVMRLPQVMEASLPGDEARIYELIWKRFVACFMSEAQIENTQVVLGCEQFDFVATGQRVLFDGFLKIYPEKIKEDMLPELSEKELIKCIDVKVEEKSTQPPPRFNDASIVRILEEKGIGRPSTYAPTISTLIYRNYLRREKSAFIPTELGIAVVDLLVKFFSDILNETFTAKMEEELDYIEKGDIPWQKILEDFYPPFKKDLEEAEKKSEKHFEPAGRTCEKCGRPMIIKHSRKGRFISCSGYPQCKNAHPITTGVKCPECKDGELVERRNRKGQRFYGCSKFPECRYTSSKLPDETAEQNQT